MRGAPSAGSGSAASARIQPRTLITSMEAQPSYTGRAGGRKMAVRWLPWLPLCTLIACPAKRTEPDAGTFDAGPAQLSEREPNDRPEDALLLTGSAILTPRSEAKPRQ